MDRQMDVSVAQGPQRVGRTKCEKPRRSLPSGNASIGSRWALRLHMLTLSIQAKHFPAPSMSPQVDDSRGLPCPSPPAFAMVTPYSLQPQVLLL